MLNYFNNIIDFIIHNIYSIYLVLILLASGLFSIIFDTDHAYFFAQYKDFVISFFFGIFNIIIAIFLIVTKIIYKQIL